MEKIYICWHRLAAACRTLTTHAHVSPRRQRRELRTQNNHITTCGRTMKARHAPLADKHIAAISVS
ncbi:MAG: hypothetical protein J6J71_03555 [Prevotella sp.]|nr:hypothetical protein [Prevotella sp.]